MKKLSFIFFLCLCLSCGVTVNYDYEKTTDFSKYKSYSYFEDIQTGLSELDAKRFFNVLEQVMSEKGYTLSENSDFLIDIKSSTYQDAQSNSSVGIGLGGGGGHVGGGVSVGIPIGQESLARHIQFDFVDAKNNQLFWQAISKETDIPNDNPTAREERFKAVIVKVLEGFPPES